MKYTLYLGLNDKDTHIQKIDTINAYKMVENTILYKGINAYTIYNGNGVYTHENGTITNENTLIIVLFDTDYIVVKNIANALKMAFNQECIALEKTKIESEFI